MIFLIDNVSMKDIFTTIIIALFWIFPNTFLIAQSYLDKNIQQAHYPLNVILHNAYDGTEVKDIFVELRNWDVSGNARHGRFINVNPSLGTEFNIQSISPFFSAYSRIPSSPIDGKLPRTYTDPDNNLLKFEYKKSTTTDLSGNPYEYLTAGKVKPGAIPWYDQKTTYTLRKETTNTNTVLRIPQPFTKANGATISFWLVYEDELATQDIDRIVTSKYLAIERVGREIRVIRNGEEIIFDLLTDFGITKASGWYFFSVSFINSENGVAVNKVDLTEWRYDPAAYDPAGTKVKSATKNFTGNIFDYELNSSKEAEIMSDNFNSQLWSMRFIQQYLNTDNVINVRNLDFQNLMPIRTNNVSYLYYTNDHYALRNATRNFELNENVADRFGRNNMALTLSGSESRKLDSFFGEYGAQQGYSVSFWTKIDEDLTSPEFPFNDDDTRYQLLYAKNSIDLLMGVQRVKDIIGVNRYFTNTATHQRKPVFAWQWDPVSFNERYGQGWYHVVLVYYPNMMRMYMFHPDTAVPDVAAENMQYEQQLLYWGGQNLADATEWGVGNPNMNSIKIKSPIQSAKFIDDIKTYTWPLDSSEVKILHYLETRTPELTHSLADQSQARTQTKAQEVKREEEAEGKLEVEAYPNPVRGDLTLLMAVPESSLIKIEIVDQLGKPMYNREEIMNAGGQEVHINNLKNYTRASGVYILKVTSTREQIVKRVIVL